MFKNRFVLFFKMLSHLRFENRHFANSFGRFPHNGGNWLNSYKCFTRICKRHVYRFENNFTVYCKYKYFFLCLKNEKLWPSNTSPIQRLMRIVRRVPYTVFPLRNWIFIKSHFRFGFLFARAIEWYVWKFYQRRISETA